MSRSRIWWISTAALLCSAVPALAYSWPALFGVPGAFGQEASQPAQTATTPPRAVSTSRPVSAALSQSHAGAEACEDNTPRPLSADCCLGDCLSSWQRLWERGEYARALGVARAALHAAPRSLAAKHALVVSQILSDVYTQRHQGSFEEAEDCPARCRSAQASAQAGSCPLPASVLLPSVQMPLLPVGAEVCSEPRQPLFIRHFEASATPPCAGNVSCAQSCLVECCADAAKGCCEKCAKECKCCCTKANKTKSQTTSFPTMPTTIFIVREPIHVATPHVVPIQVPLPHVVPLPPPPVMPPAPIFSYAPAFPPPPSVAVAPPVGRPAPAVTLAEYEPHGWIVGEKQYQVHPGTEACVPVEVSVPVHEAAPASPKVRILQRGGMCFVSSPNFEVRCDRVQSQEGDRLVLEGKVTLVSRRHGQTMTIEAERITLNVNTDQFRIDNARGLEQTRFNVAPVGATPACVPIGRYGASAAEECNVPAPNPRMEQLRNLLQMRKSERQAYEQALLARWKEMDSGKADCSDYLLEAISRFVRATQRERETAEEYEALQEQRGGPARYYDVYEVPVVPAPGTIAR